MYDALHRYRSTIHKVDFFIPAANDASFAFSLGCDEFSAFQEPYVNEDPRNGLTAGSCQVGQRSRLVGDQSEDLAPCDLR